MRQSRFFPVWFACAMMASPAFAGARMNNPLAAYGANANDASEMEQGMEILPPPSSGRSAYNAPAPRPSQRQNSMGGGFIEMLANGFSGGPQANAVYNEPARQRYASYAPDGTQARRSVPQEYMRTEVDFPTRERAGSIIIDTQEKYLYYVMPQGRAIRYGIGVGRPGFTWTGVKSISRKAEWPGWTPPPQMMRRRPDLPSHMEGGEDNPLGARAMYLGSSLYRIHGTNEPYTIGQNVSSGCIRLTNEDVSDLYDRVKIGARVTVM